MWPFVNYFGGKARASKNYPAPEHGTIIEPFAGMAGYSLRHHTRRVVLIEKYPTLAELWRWLIKVDPADVLRIPLVDAVDELPPWVPQPARDLVGFSLNSGTTSPCRVLSSGLRKLRAGETRYGTPQPTAGWSEKRCARIAQQVQYIRHWQIIEGDYTAAPSIKATWFIDAPYQGKAGNRYVYGSSLIDYAALAGWCRSRQGQVIVCEAVGATWLPFRPFKPFKAGPRSHVSHEAIWLNEST